MVTKSDKSLSPFGAPAKDRSGFRQALPQILAVCVKNVLLLGFGMTLGFPTILIPSLSGNNPEEPISLDQEAISWIGSINLICVPIGCLLSGAITQPIGRKRAMQLVNIPFLAAWLLFYFSKEPWQIFLALCITGVTGGLLEAPVITYVAEITQPHLRGMLSSTSTMSVNLGLCSQFLFGTFLNFRQICIVNAFFPIIGFLLLFFVPETPLWLIAKNRFLDARKSLAWLRGWTSLNEIELEFQELCKELGKGKEIGIESAEEVERKKSRIELLKMFVQRDFLWRYGLVSLTFLLQHFGGITTLTTYSVGIFASLHSPIDKYWATAILGTSGFFGCLISVCLIHYLGKRMISFITLTGCGCCFLIVATYAQIIGVKNLTFSDNAKSQTDYVWIPTFFLITAAFLASAGVKSLPWILIGEVFSNETRAAASGLSSATAYIFGFFSNKLFLSMVASITLPGAFWFNSAVSLVGVVILYFFLPETEGRTLYDINEHFLGHIRLGNKVYRKSKSKSAKAGAVNQGFTKDNNGYDENQV